MAIETRTVRPEEYEEAGRVTALAYREFVRPGEQNWEEYLGRIADVAGRAGRALILVAVDDGRILGSATLELSTRIDEDDPPLAADEAHVRMVGVHPDTRGRGVGRMLMDACMEEARRGGNTGSRSTPQPVCGRLSGCTSRSGSSEMRIGSSPTASSCSRSPRIFETESYELAEPLAVRTISPVDSTTPSSHSASTRPLRNCCS